MEQGYGDTAARFMGGHVPGSAAAVNIPHPDGGGRDPIQSLTFTPISLGLSLRFSSVLSSLHRTTSTSHDT